MHIMYVIFMMVHCTVPVQYSTFQYSTAGILVTYVFNIEYYSNQTLKDIIYHSIYRLQYLYSTYMTCIHVLMTYCKSNDMMF